MKMRKILITTFLLFVSIGKGYSQEVTPFLNTDLPIDVRVDDLMQRLTMEEKISFLEHRNPAIPRLGIKEYSWWNEALHGVARNGKALVYPIPMAMAATFDPELIEKAFKDISYEAIYKYDQAQKNNEFGDYQGLTFFTPNINIARDPRWGRAMETFGEDPFLTSRIGLSVVLGLQGRDSTKFRVAACIKHLAVHSGPEYLRHQWNSSVGRRDLWTTYLPAFEYIIKNSNVQQVMCGYNTINGEPCCNNSYLLTEVLRNRWNYNGILVTDCWALNDLWERDTVIPRHAIYEDAQTTAAKAFGNEVDLECGSGLQALKDAYNEGLIPDEVINKHVRRVLRTRMLAESTNLKAAKMRYYEMGSENSRTALNIATKSIVMLKNEKVLPLTYNGYYKMALIGPNANDSVMQLGNYNGDPLKLKTIKAALETYMDDFNENSKGKKVSIYHEKACNVSGNGYELPSDFWQKIAQQDVVVFCGGLSPELEGEELQVDEPGFLRGDRTRIELPEVQLNLIKEIKQKTNKPVVLVICSGSSIALEEVEPYVDGILVAWYGGEQMGTAVAHALEWKEFSFGKLPITFYKSTSQLPDYEDYGMKGRTYRYLDSEPMYPFGFGLNYGKFSISNVTFDADGLKVKGTLKNNSTDVKDGHAEEVVQVYVKNLSDIGAPKKSLAGFKRINLATGDSRDFEIVLDRNSFRSFSDEEGEWMDEIKGEFVIQVGTSSADNDLKDMHIKL